MPERFRPLGRTAIAPSILTADLTRLGEQIAEVEAAGADLIHLDIMDGRFVPNISIGLPVVQAVAGTTELTIDVHLMIIEPERYVKQFIAAGAQIVTVHVEASPHLHRTIQQIKELGASAGVALNPATPLSAIEEILPIVDLVLVMSVNPGFGGQTLIPLAVEKLRRLRATVDPSSHQPLLQIDGGIKESNIKRVAAAGADIVVVGSAIYTPERSVSESMALLRGAL